MNPKKFKKVIFNLYWNPVVVLKKISLFCMSLIFDVVHFFLKAAKRMLVISKNPKIILISFLKTFKKTKNFIKNLPKLSIEYFFLMVMSAENNIHRFKRKNIADIPHLSEIKNYQKNLRKKTFKFVFTGAMAILLVISLPGLFHKYFAQSKGYQWIQINWTGAGDTNAKITSSSNWSNWTNYYSKSGVDIDANGASGIALHQYTASNVTETGGSYSGSLSNGSGMYAVGNFLKLKKPVGAPCGATAGGDSIGNGECVSNDCRNNACYIPPCGSGVTQFVDTRGSESITYPVVNIGTQCWFAENLRTAYKPNGVALSEGSEMYSNPAGSGSPWGKLYNWNIAMNGASAASGAGAKIQGICPSGWHIPSDYNQTAATDDFLTLSTYLGGTTVAGGKMKRTEVPTYWNSPNTSASNSSGFSAVGAGMYFSGSYYQRLGGAYFWSSSQVDATRAWMRPLSAGNADMGTGLSSKTDAASVRSVKD